MSGETHAGIGIAASLAPALYLPGVATANQIPLIAASALIGSLFPDLDLSKSKGSKSLNKVLPVILVAPFYFLLEVKIGLTTMVDLIDHLTEIIAFLVFIGIGLWCKTRPHREASHSLIMLFATSACFYLFANTYWRWYAIGYLSHILIDLLNSKGESLLFPLDYKFCLNVCSSNGTVNNVLQSLSYFANIIFIMKVRLS